MKMRLNLKWIERLVLTLFLGLFCFESYAQPWALDIQGTVISQNDRSKISGAQVTIFRNGSKSDQVTTDSKGKFSLSLGPDAKYSLEFTYPGHVKKKISFNTKNVPPEMGEGGNFLFRFDMTLFQEMEGLDVSILNQPVAEVTFDPNMTDFNYDKEYTKSITQQMEKMYAELEEKLAAAAEAEKEKEAEFNSNMSDGAKAMAKSDYASAKMSFAAALEIKPNDQSAKSKLEDAQKKYDKAQAEKNIEKNYTEAIENAEFALHDKDYKTAEAEFQKAFDLKPGDIYARDQIKEIRDLMANAARSEQAYIVAIGKGDAALAAEDYITAKAEYTKAKDAKPDEQYPKDQLEHVEGLLVADAQKESDYIKAIERGETSMENNDLEAAKAAFEQASSVKPNEKYPKEQIVKITAMMEKIALANQNYDAAIKKGDEAFAQNDFDNARKSYEEALGLKPDEQYPKDQIAAIAAKQDELKAKEQEYADLIKDADQRYESHDLIAALSEYKKALAIKPDEAHPKQRVEEIAITLEKEAKIEEEYKSAISNADNAFKAKDYSSAKFEYQAALKLKPDELYPQEQLDKVEGFLADAAKQEADYAQAIKDGDTKYEAGEFEAAKEFYTTAQGLKPEEEYPPKQIELIDQKLVELANLNKDYAEAIAKGDEAFDGKDFENARTSFEKALELKPSEAYPKEKIAAITTLLAAAEVLEANYSKLIADGDGAMTEKNYEAAQTAFTSASELKPEESYPKEKLAEIEKLAAEIAATKQAYDEAIAIADAAFNENKLEEAIPLYEKAAGIKEGESYPVEQIALIESKLAELKQQDEQYNNAIAEAEEAEKNEDYTAAIASFKKAGEIKSEESYPKEKVTELTALVAELDKKSQEYNDAIAMADEAKANGEFDIAITAFNKASSIKPEEEYPKAQIKECEQLKADALAAIELANKQEEEYKALIAEGDELFGKESYEESRSKFEAALGVKPTEDYPKTKMAEIDKLIVGLAEQQAIDENYSALIAEADAAFKSEDWDVARAKYTEAQGVKPAESYPGTQLTAIEAAIGEAAALAAQLEKEQAAKELDEKYNAAIASADDAFKAKDWDQAKSGYNVAKGLKPNEAYPTEQLAAIDVAIAEANALADQQALELAAKERDEKYNAAIAVADDAFKSEDWEAARVSYTEAKGIKSEESYPSSQLAAIDAAIAEAALLADQAAKEQAAKEMDEKYNAAIAFADDAFKSKDWETAKSGYNEAKGLKPNEAYPTEQLAAIGAAIAEAAAMADKEAQERAAKELEENYKAAISVADKAFKSRDWETAKSSYNEAKGLKPAETYPSEQLTAIELAISEESKLAAASEKEAQYKSFIEQGDAAFKGEDWETAKLAFNSALGLKPSEEYPKKKLQEIENEIAESSKAAKKEDYDAYISTADKAFKDKDWNSARTNYNSASKVFPDESYPYDQLKRIDEAEAREDAIALANKKEEDYSQFIGDADQLFNNEDWSASKSKYEAALGIKPNEIYPQDRIAEIEGKLGELKDAQAQLDAKYKNLIAKADADFNDKKYKPAKASYAAAIKIKDESYPRDRMDEIDELLAKIEANRDAKQREIELKQAEYDELVAKADAQFRSKDYKAARSNYESALAILPSQAHPKNKINEIDKLLHQKKEVAVVATPEPKKSSGMSEAEIAAMMSKWQQERDQAKVDQLNQYQKDLKETSDERIGTSDDNRAEASDELVNLAVVLSESNKAGKDRNLDEAQLIEGIREDQTDFRNDLNKDASDNRQDKYADFEKNQEGQKKMKEEGNDLYQVNTEISNTQKIELSNAQHDRKNDGDIKIAVNSEQLVELEDGLREDRDTHNDDHMKNVEEIQKQNALVTASINTWSDESREVRSDSYDDIKRLDKETSEFRHDNRESYKYNTDKYWETTDGLKDYRDDKNKESQQNRDKAYGAIEDYVAEVGEITEERHNKYNENNEKIRNDQMAITDFTAELVADADERRLNYDGNFYTGEKKPRYPELAKQKPQGVTEETFEEDDAFVVKRTVVKGENIDEYKKIYYKWGGIYYKKNGQNVTETIWNAETQ